MLGYALVFVVGFVFFVVMSMFGHDDVQLDADGGESSTPSLLSLKNISLFCVGFGATGAIILYYFPGNHLAAAAGGVVLGVLMAAIAFTVGMYFRSQQSTTEQDPKDIIGQSAHVSVRINPNSIGQISAVDRRGAIVYYAAKSGDGQSHEVGSMVKVSEMLGSTAIVFSVS